MFSKQTLKAATAALSIALLGTVFVGCGGKDAADSNTIKIGANFEMTGNVANYGNDTLNGLKLAIKEANEAGGINGKQIELITVDNKSEAAEAINAATKLIADEGVVTIVGPAVTGLVVAETQVATENKIPILAPDATNTDATLQNGEVKPYVFTTCFTDPQQAKVMVQFALKDLSAKTAVIYTDTASDYSKNLGKVFKEEFEAAGGKVVMEEAFIAKDQDFKATLTKIKTANADVIFVPAYYEEVGKIVKQARELGITTAILGTDGWDDAKVIDIAGADALNNTFFSTHYFEKDAEVQPFLTSYQKEYNKLPNVFAALGYDAGKVLIDALKRAGSAEPEAIRKAIEETKDLQVGTGTISMNPSHNPTKTAVVLETVNGEKTLRAKISPSE
ncbi:ABC transporter substrate-binding protein [Selenomonas sp. TAMA-11512]|uniref:ABC transporter substrate-binding protein n=1 Tax=Selenomonas sp. TAMA-11512 TaxID=3095337 RepID=UPI00308796C2|nr:ABC transporter substrate-binding protein [Selenomonas sp. TAMA-11512]